MVVANESPAVDTAGSDNEPADEAPPSVTTQETAPDGPSTDTPEPDKAPDPTPDPKPEVASESDVSETHDHVAIRNFTARFEHQVLKFVKDDIIDSRVGKALRAKGAPIKLVEKTEEPAGEL